MSSKIVTNRLPAEFLHSSNYHPSFRSGWGGVQQYPATRGGESSRTQPWPSIDRATLPQSHLTAESIPFLSVWLIKWFFQMNKHVLSCETALAHFDLCSFPHLAAPPSEKFVNISHCISSKKHEVTAAENNRQQREF